MLKEFVSIVFGLMMGMEVEVVSYGVSLNHNTSVAIGPQMY